MEALVGGAGAYAPRISSGPILSPLRAPQTGRLLQANTPSASQTGRLLQANTLSGPKRRHVLHCSGLRGEKGGLFFTVPGCAAKKAVCFSPFRAAR